MATINDKSYRAIIEHTESEYPHESGGMLLGKFYEDGVRTITETFPLENARAEEDRHDRILILPKDILRVEKYARENGLDVVGYYHSHPEDAAIPSQYDLDHALPVWSYIIASVMNKKTVDMRSWVMRDDRSQFDEENISRESAVP